MILPNFPEQEVRKTVIAREKNSSNLFIPVGKINELQAN